MSEFFDSEFVQESLKDINRLQEQIYSNAFNFSTLSREEQLNHVEMLEELLEKQRLMYTRLSLSNDPEAIKLKDRLKESVAMMGFPSDTDVTTLFGSMSETIQKLRDKVDY
tara:strand:+ start:1082 stop:1414 length:333 start_codon:yes stop_codon:yes gene_type:complete